MKHIIFLYYILAFSIGVSSLFLSLFIYWQYRKKVLITWSLYLLSLTLYLLTICIPFYKSIVLFRNIDLINSINAVVFTIGHSIFISNTPFLCHYLFGISLNRIKTILFCTIGLIVFSFCIVNIFNPTSLFHTMIFIPSFFGMIIYSLLVTQFNIKKLGNKTLKRSLRIFLLVIIIFSPWLFMDFFFGQEFLFAYNLSFPTFFLIISTLNILFSLRFFNQPFYFENNVITPHFISLFDITNREEEIIALVVKGLSNKEIGDKSFISIKTVESHLYHIFQKTGVKNRVQLINLIQTNRR